MEVFVTFRSEDEALPLADTVKRWAKCKNASPCVIQVPDEMYEIRRRVLADNLAREEYYILADIGCVPGDKSLINKIKDKIKENPEINMFGLIPAITTKMPPDYPAGVRVCRKGVVSKWPMQVSENYDKEHADATKSYLLLGDCVYADLSQC